jgi:hypothetical protein
MLNRMLQSIHCADVTVMAVWLEHFTNRFIVQQSLAHVMKQTAKAQADLRGLLLSAAGWLLCVKMTQGHNNTLVYSELDAAIGKCDEQGPESCGAFQSSSVVKTADGVHGRKTLGAAQRVCAYFML